MFQDQQPEDPEPSERFPAGQLFVPVRSGSALFIDATLVQLVPGI